MHLYSYMTAYLLCQSAVLLAVLCMLICDPSTTFRHPSPLAAQVRDLWLEEDVGIFTTRFTALKVEPHEGRMVTLRWAGEGHTHTGRLLGQLP